VVGALFCGGVFYGPLSGTLVCGVLAAAARGGVVSKGWEKLRDAKAISIYYAVAVLTQFSIHSMQLTIGREIFGLCSIYVNLQEYTRCGHSHHNVAPHSTLSAPQMWQILYVFW
jgi:hypothetical protein